MANTLDCYVKFNQLTVCVNMKFCLLAGKLEPCSFFLSFFLTIKLQHHHFNIEFYQSLMTMIMILITLSCAILFSAQEV